MLGLGRQAVPMPLTTGGNTYPGSNVERSVWIDLIPNGQTRSGVKMLLIAGAAWALWSMTMGGRR